MRKVFTSLFMIVALLASTSAMAENSKKETVHSKVETESPAKSEEKKCDGCQAGEKKECCQEDKACDKKADAKSCTEMKTGSENKSCGKKK